MSLSAMSSTNPAPNGRIDLDPGGQPRPRRQLPTNGHSAHHTPLILEDDDERDHDSLFQQRQNAARIDSFSLFQEPPPPSSQQSSSSSSQPPLVFSQVQFEQFQQFRQLQLQQQQQQQRGQPKPIYPEPYNGIHQDSGASSELSDLSPLSPTDQLPPDQLPDLIEHPTDDDEEDPEFQVHQTASAYLDQETFPIAQSDQDGMYENYMLDYDADYNQYYDTLNAQHNGYLVPETEDDEEFVDHDPNPTYVMRPPGYNQFQNPQMIQMIQHPYMYANPFSYNLHTIIEESENSELSSLASSSNFASLPPHDPHGGSQVTTPTNHPRPSGPTGRPRGSSSASSSTQLGELSDPSLSPDSSPTSSQHPSPQSRTKFTKKLSKKSSKPIQENFSEISFSSSTSAEEDDEEEDPHDLNEPEPVDLLVNDDPMFQDPIQINESDSQLSTTSKLERYFTSSLLEAKRQSKAVPKIIPKDQPALESVPKPTKAKPQHQQNPQKSKSSTRPKVSATKTVSKPELTQQLRTLLRALLTHPHPLTVDQINLLNHHYLKLDWIRSLQWILTRSFHGKVPGSFRKLLPYSTQAIVDHLALYYLHTVGGVHLVRDNRLAGPLLERRRRQLAAKKLRKTDHRDPGRSQSIQIRINQGNRSMIIIHNDGKTPTGTVPKIPNRSRKANRAPGPPITSESGQSPSQNRKIYRTIVAVNNDDQQQQQKNQVPPGFDAEDPKSQRHLSKLLLQSNPLNRNFIAKTLLHVQSPESDESKRLPETITKSEESELSAKSKKSATHLLLGSLRNRSKERNGVKNGNGAIGPDGSDPRTNGKFKTLSNLGHRGHQNGQGLVQAFHSKVTPTKSVDGREILNRSNGATVTPTVRLDRHGKGSKSFRDTRLSESGPSTWDSIYGSGLRLLKNISFGRSKSKPPTLTTAATSGDPDRVPEDEEEADSLRPMRTRSEPNLHKKSRRGKAPEAPNSSADSKSTPQLAESKIEILITSHESDDDDESPVPISSPSQLYRLSNASRSSGRSGRNVQMAPLRMMESVAAQENGAWQRMQQSEAGVEDANHSATLKWSKKPSLNNGSKSNSFSSQHAKLLDSTETLKGAIEYSPSAMAALTPAMANQQAVCGEIALSLNYDMRIGCLELSIHKCRIDLLPAKNKTDLYVKVYLLPERSKSNKRKTRVVRAAKAAASRSPHQIQAEFKETLRFIGPFSQFTGQQLLVSVWQSDTFGRNTPVGEMCIGPLDPSVLSSGQLSNLSWYRLIEVIQTPKARSISPSLRSPFARRRSKSPVAIRDEPKEQPDLPALVGDETDDFAGTIFVAIKYSQEPDSVEAAPGGALNILIKEAQNLQFASCSAKLSAPNQIGSTMCKLSLQPNRNKLDQMRTTGVKCPLEYSANPRWNQQFTFRSLAGVADLRNRSLLIEVLVQVEQGAQKSGKKHLIGAVRLSGNGVESTPEEMTLWNQILDRPNMWAYGEVALRSF